MLKSRHKKTMGGRCAGFSLLEALVALLVFSLGLIGLAGMLVISVKSNQSAYVRTQVSFLAQSMADRMRANAPRVWSGDYSTTYPTADTEVCTSAATACTPANVATRDRAQWSSQIRELLPPGASATIQCTPSALITVSSTDQANGAPYTGLCTIAMAWGESTLDQANNSPNTETLVWKFQP